MNDKLKKIMEDHPDLFPVCNCAVVRQEKIQEAQRLGLPGAWHHCNKCKTTWIGTTLREEQSDLWSALRVLGRLRNEH